MLTMKHKAFDSEDYLCEFVNSVDLEVVQICVRGGKYVLFYRAEDSINI